MPRHLLIGVLVGLVASSGCSGPRLIVRADRGEEMRVDESKVHPVEYEEEDLREALEGPYAHVMGELIRQHDAQLRVHLTSAVIPGADAADLAFVEEYLSWCGVTRGQRGDCADARDPRMPGLTIDGKRGIALRMAFSSAMSEAAEVIRGINPMKIEAMMLMWFAFYLASFVIPEPITKLLDVILTANLIAFLGVDGFHNVIEGYLDLRKDAADAKDFAALHDAGLKYGRRLGPSMLRLVTALITLGLATKAGVGGSPTELPGGEVAAMNAQALGFDLATVSGGSVAVSTSGTVTLVVAMSGRPGQGGGGDGASKAEASKPEPDTKETPSIRWRLRRAKLPGGSRSTQVGPFRFRPDGRYRPGNPLAQTPGGGYIDRFKNVWQRGPYHGDPSKPFDFEWDVQLSPAGRQWPRDSAWATEYVSMLRLTVRSRTE